MRIISGSWPEDSGGFLHAGYLSAAPRPLERYSVQYQLPSLGAIPEPGAKADASAGQGYRSASHTPMVADEARPVYSTDVVIDTAQALRLTGEVLTPRHESFPVSPAAIRMGHEVYLFSVTAVFFVLLALFYKLRARPASRYLLAAMLVAAIGLGAFVCFSSPELPVAAPWEGVELRSYADPELATRVLMYGIIADALMATPKHITALPQLVSEVGLPAQHLTEGQAYALRTYGIDGWGHPFRLESERKDASLFRQGKVPYIYRLSSAGPDGVFDSGDDVQRYFNMPVEYTWDTLKPVIFVRKNSEDAEYLYHRWGGMLYRPADLEEARRYTGTGLYDILKLKENNAILGDGETWHDPLADVARTCRSLWNGLPYDPVYLVLLSKDASV